MKTLILYYLSIKPTHGYEIQRFIEINELNRWTRIQSGSIYYALSKLEKDGLIERTGRIEVADKARKCYRITDSGRRELQSLIRKTIASPLCDVGSDQFFLYPVFTCLEPPELEAEVHAHIGRLQHKRDYLLSWKEIKIGPGSLESEKQAFDLMIGSLNLQIRWYEAVLEDYDAIAGRRGEFDRLITAFSCDASPGDLMQTVYGPDGP